MKMTLLTIGRVKESEILTLCSSYLKKLVPYGTFTVEELRESRKTLPDDRKSEESETIASHLTAGQPVWILDERGEEWTSLQLAKQIDVWEGSGVKKIQWVIGGPFGLSDDFKKKHPTFALSKLTLTHDMARLFFLEQIYRAYTISRHIPYHH